MNIQEIKVKNMEFEIRPVEEFDASAVIDAWNESYIHDVIDEARFKKVIFDDPNYDREANLVAIKDGNVIGFISCVAREGIKGRDGGGIPEDRDFGYIKGFFGIEGSLKDEVKTRLLESAMDYLRLMEKRIVKVGNYTGNYFFPGIDVRYDKKISYYEKQGFEYLDFDEDVAIDLDTFTPSSQQEEVITKVKDMGVEFIQYEPRYLELVSSFVETLEYPAWFPYGWDSTFGAKGNTIIALKEGKVVGFAVYHPGSKEFGPIAVLLNLRGQGIGMCLLLESLQRMKDLGVMRVVAGWANTSFYLRNKWHVSRTYKVYQKML